MISFKQFIVEGKQVGTIYHYSSPESIHSILKDDRIKASDYNEGHISFTRDKLFHKEYRSGIKPKVSLELDGDKLSDRYKFKPYHDRDLDHERSITDRAKDENEERVRPNKHWGEEEHNWPVGHIKNVKSYVKKIRIHSPISDEHMEQLKSHGIPIEHVK